ncbi:MAG: amidohydrolase [Phycisphaerae bacterium]|nr:amidohydrolase [Phycisphaerae bacterium]
MSHAALPTRVRLEGARFWTADPAQPWARSIDIHDGHIAAVDAPARTDTPVITLPNLVVTPGLIDAHLHLTLGADTLSQLDLSGVRSRAEFEAEVARACAELPPGAWLRAHGWDERSWGGERPTLDWLRAAGDRPAVAYRMDQHVCLVNHVVLTLMGATADAATSCRCPAGGEIVRHASGAPTGLMLEQAAWQLVNPLVPKPDIHVARAALVQACAHANRHGLTTVGSMEYAVDLHHVHDWLRANQREQLTLRVRATLLDRDWPVDLEFGSKFAGDALIAIVGYKSFVDGTLGSRTARMLQPYRDDPQNSGMLVEFAAHSTERLQEWMRTVVKHGFSPSVHAIGDAALRVALDCAATTDPARLTRFEHVQTVHTDDVARMSGRIASMQPLHKCGDARVAPARLGQERMHRFFRFRDLANAGARLAFGSDWPIVSLDPRLGIRAAVTGLDDAGEPCGTDQNLTAHEALHAYTAGAADALRDPMIGRLAPGAHADLAAWADDPFEHDWVRSLPTLAGTVLGGRVVWRSPALTGVLEVAR